MKKLLGILVLGLLFSGSANAECVKGNCTNGKGIEKNASGKYIGEFKDGKRHGQGTYVEAIVTGTIFPRQSYKGGKYTGEWKDGYRHGQGTYESIDGIKYTGEFKEGKRIKSKKVEIKSKQKPNKYIAKKSKTPISKERSEKEVKMGVFLEDLESIGTYRKIEQVPVGLFDQKYNSFTAQATYSLSQVGIIFVKRKGLLEKYPSRMMKGMAYFEFFYQQQLKDNKRAIEKFETNYPTWDPGNIKSIQKLHSLNKARKSMREALGLSLDDDIETVLSTQLTMYKLYEQSNTSKNKLTKDEKKLIKIEKTINKEIGKAKALVEKRIENRITKDKFLKEYSKVNKKLNNALKKAEYRKEYELFSSFVEELHDFKNEDTSALLSGYKVASFILKDLKKSVLKSNYTQDLSKADFSNFTQDELIILGNITKYNKLNKNIKSNEIQIDILNLENNKLPVSKLLDVYKNDLDVKLESLNLQLASAESMNRWVLSDWANAWKNPIPTKVQDAAGIEVNLSEKEIESIKAQLAMQNFKEIVEVDQFKDLVANNSDLNDLQTMVSESTKSLSFSYGLDDYAAALGDMYKMDINNYADLTALANAELGTNYSVEEYASAYQLNVDAINALQQGIGSEEIASLASSIGASLQDVADTITAASAAGISVDLEAAAEGLGYDNFADAVAAYNAEHGTSYTEQQARDALGQ
jgi:hypothetical protein